MKNKIIFSILALIIISGVLFFTLKWDQLKYYFKTDKTELIAHLIDTSGKAGINEPITYTYNVKNVGENPLKIEEVLTECDCLITDFKKDEISVGESTNISVTFKSTSKGEFEKNMLLVANTAPPFTVLKLKATID